MLLNLFSEVVHFSDPPLVVHNNHIVEYEIIDVMLLLVTVNWCLLGLLSYIHFSIEYIIFKYSFIKIIEKTQIIIMDQTNVELRESNENYLTWNKFDRKN